MAAVPGVAAQCRVESDGFLRLRVIERPPELAVGHRSHQLQPATVEALKQSQWLADVTAERIRQRCEQCFIVRLDRRA